MHKAMKDTHKAYMYLYGSAPRAAGISCVHRRDFIIQKAIRNGTEVHAGIQFDPCVVRGNTFALKEKSNTMHRVKDRCEVERTMRTQSKMAKKYKPKAKSHLQTIPVEFKSGDSRKRINSDKYLIEHCTPTHKKEAGSQCDKFNKYIEVKKPCLQTGVNVSTQIGIDDLNDTSLDKCVRLIIDKTMEQAVLEISQELEINDIRKEIKNLTKISNLHEKEMANQKQMESEYNNILKEEFTSTYHNNRVEDDVCNKIACVAYSKAYLANLLPCVLRSLTRYGVIDMKQVKKNDSFMERLTNSVTEHIDKKLLARRLLDSLIRYVVEKRSQNYDDLDEYRIYCKEHNIKEKVIKKKRSNPPIDLFVDSTEELSNEEIISKLRDSVFGDDEEWVASEVKPTTGTNTVKDLDLPVVDMVDNSSEDSDEDEYADSDDVDGDGDVISDGDNVIDVDGTKVLGSKKRKNKNRNKKLASKMQEEDIINLEILEMESQAYYDEKSFAQRLYGSSTNLDSSVGSNLLDDYSDFSELDDYFLERSFDSEIENEEKEGEQEKKSPQFNAVEEK